MNRNFSDEAYVNLIFRLKRSIMGRVRGRFYCFFGAFAKGSAKSVFFGSGAKFMNSKAILFNGRNAFGAMARIETYRQSSQIFKPLITIGNNTSFGEYAHIGAIRGVHIGNNVLGGSNILIVDHNHGKPLEDLKNRTEIIPRERPLDSKGEIIIEDNVWICDNCVILGGTHIGKGAIIPAGSIVKGTVAPYSIYS